MFSLRDKEVNVGRQRRNELLLFPVSELCISGICFWKGDPENT